MGDLHSIMPEGGGGMLHEDVVARVREMLLDGAIPPGSRIAERELCDRFRVSRTPLREALKVLAAEGLVVLLPNRGARAAKPTSRSLQDLFEVCEGLEALAGELACRRITDAQLATIRDLHDEMVECYRADDLAQYFRCNRLIHDAIVRAADNAPLMALYESVASRIRSVRYLAPMPAAHWAVAIKEHEGILNALERRDGPGLAHILRHHLRVKRKQVEEAGLSDSVETSVPANAA
jgi:DNA-binding GntR family transcriptional regulator